MIGNGKSGRRESFDELFNRADAKMYDTKNKMKNGNYIAG